jgi:N,N-dimethylformamidase
MQVIGYVDRLSARPGEEIGCHVSLEQAGEVDVDVVRLIHGDKNPRGPGFKVEPTVSIPMHSLTASPQPTHTGSCMVASDLWEEAPSALSLELLVWPTLPQRGHRQGLISLRGANDEILALAVAADGELELVSVVRGKLRSHGRTHTPLPEREWCSVRVMVDAHEQSVTLVFQQFDRLHTTGPARQVSVGAAVTIPAFAECVVGALSCRFDRGRSAPDGCFNGKIEHPMISGGSTPDEAVLADWRFEHGLDGPNATDISGRGRRGVLINNPTRAMTGRAWAGDELSHVYAPDQYAAVHFHEDDLEDAGWPESVRIAIPVDLRSGVYAVRLRNGEHVDHVPFCVTPSRDGKRAPVTLLLPTFSYLAYANEHLLERGPHSIEIGPHDRAVLEHPEFSRSLYDRHLDGSGVCYASSRRPLVNIRPDYRSWVHDAPRHLSADLYIVDWLEHLDVEYDVVTDHDLHREGCAALGDTLAVITGGHPEYVSVQILDALDAHLEDGGRLMYLGGNGFYWVTSQNRDRDHIIEVRRGVAGTRTWESEPGESCHSTTGEPGGLWRHRGRPPNALVGVGFSAQLTGVRDAEARSALKAPGYCRMPDSFRSEVAFAFEGISGREIIGDFGLVMNGASGDELDRYDTERGSPADALLLARSTGHSQHYLLCSEDVRMVSATLAGTNNELVRSDIVLSNRPEGGAVFSVGSICFSGSLSHNGYDNNVARLATNVLREFMRR